MGFQGARNAWNKTVEDELMIADPTDKGQESLPASEEPTLNLGSIGQLMEEAAMASDVLLVNKWVKRVQENRDYY
jgi:hypothetical protein